MTATTPPAPVPEFLDDLAGTVQREWGADGPVRLTGVDRRSEGNSWETYLATVEWSTDGRPRRTPIAVKRQPVAGIVGDYDVDREVVLLAAAARSGCPVPRVLAHRVGGTGGRGFFVMEQAQGRIPLPGDLGRELPDPADRARLGRDIAAVMATLHAGPVDDPELARVLGTTPDEARSPVREVGHWDAAYRAVPATPVPLLDLALDWLHARTGAVSGRVALVHNDLRVGNIVLTDGRLSCVLDWETAHLGDPAADLAWFGMRTFRGRSASWGRLLREDEFLDHYAVAAGWRPSTESLRYWTVLGLVKTAVGCLQAVRMYSDGSRGDLRYANMAHSVHYGLYWLAQMLRDREWGE
ncbi:phosphotransferase [Nakamurella sp. YIM 132087]|uniref:Phosphotransferase n=1 Tax=Nakamurella alba TaxID=2665158 RepID=A0A7K1FG38_9ACTN|nr:phosphotransferase family protein [Nakamurella alba]MTD13030.1 phosphotransferase [Nakamurella alba]